MRKDFQKIVWAHYRKKGRKLPWRPTTRRVTRDKNFPYKILVSEVMLQQTQVDRVLPKYRSFIHTFPDFKTLACSSLAAILKEWQGLGYNRRALHLKRAAEAVVQGHGGKLPRDYAALRKLPGIGPYTAKALRAFIWNVPETLIETNIRTVYIHHFFPKKKRVSDRAIYRSIDATLDKRNSREWYYALMDYGAHLKKTIGNASRASAHYKKQTAFKGSRRQLRGLIIKRIGARGMHLKALLLHTKRTLPEIEEALRALAREGLVEEHRGIVRITR